MLNKHIYNYISQLVLLFLLFTLISCTVINDTSSKNKVINTLERISLNYYKIDKLLLVNIENQEMYLLQKGTIINKYPISTSVYGTGSEINSLHRKKFFAGKPFWRKISFWLQILCISFVFCRQIFLAQQIFPAEKNFWPPILCISFVFCSQKTAGNFVFFCRKICLGVKKIWLQVLCISFVF